MKVVIYIALCLVGVYGQEEQFFVQCKRNDPQIEQCVLNSLEGIRPMLKVGVPQYNIPAIDPFTLPRLKLNRTADNLRIKAVIKQTTAYGASNFQIQKLRINLNNKYAAEVKLFLPALYVNSDFDVRGSRVLALDLTGQGRMRGNFSNIQVVAKGAAKPITKNGEQYLQTDRIIVKIRVGDAQLQVDPSVGLAVSSAIAFFNASPRPVLDVLNPLIEETAAAVAKSIANKILGSIPIKDFLTD